MLNINKMTLGQESYYRELAREDYYLEGGEPPGQWVGKGAEKLALFGQVKPELLSEIFRGELDGKKLVQRAPSQKPRTPGWDCTFSAPKSVSVAWSQADKELGNEIRAAHAEAVNKALEYLEEKAGFTRRGRGGHELEKCSLVFATYEHGTSRAQDPQLHTHALLLNAAVRADGTTGALYTNQMYQYRFAAGALYRAELATQLERRLGLRSVKDGFSFKLQGVSEELVETFSTRRAEIEAKLKQSGRSGAIASEEAALYTRSKKEHRSRAELFPDWQKTGQKHGWSLDQLKALAHGPTQSNKEQNSISGKLSALTAFEEITQKQTTFTEAQLTNAAAVQAQDKGIGIEAIEAGVRFMLEDKAVINLGQVQGQVRYTSKEILNLEENMLTKANRLKELKPAVRVSDRHLERATKQSTLTDEQAGAVKFITQDTKRVAVVVGDAGTGKTYMLNVARKAWERAGHDVMGIALAGKAADGLQQGAGIQSSTIASLLFRLDKEQEAKHQGNHNRKPILTEKTVLVMDEAGMVGTRQMERLMQEVSKAGAKLVLVGDQKQLQAIEHGGAFAALDQELGSCRLTKVMRQSDPQHAAAIGQIAAGQVKESLDYYAKQGLLHIAGDRSQARSQMVEAWRKAGGDLYPEKHLMLAGRKVDVQKLNHEAQDLRLASGELSARSISVNGDKFRLGERIVFTKNSREFNVKNGQFGEITSLDLDANRIIVRLDERKGKDALRVIKLSEYEDIKLGYAVTTHKSQGMTTEHSYVLTDETMQDRELSYVQMSRAKESTNIFTTEDEAGEELSMLARRMERSRQEELALLQKEQARKEHAQEI